MSSPRAERTTREPERVDPDRQRRRGTARALTTVGGVVERVRRPSASGTIVDREQRRASTHDATTIAWPVTAPSYRGLAQRGSGPAAEKSPRATGSEPRDEPRRSEYSPTARSRAAAPIRARSSDRRTSSARARSRTASTSRGVDDEAGLAVDDRLVRRRRCGRRPPAPRTRRPRGTRCRSPRPRARPSGRGSTSRTRRRSRRARGRSASGTRPRKRTFGTAARAAFEPARGRGPRPRSRAARRGSLARPRRSRRRSPCAARAATRRARAGGRGRGRSAGGSRRASSASSGRKRSPSTPGGIDDARAARRPATRARLRAPGTPPAATTAAAPRSTRRAERAASRAAARAPVISAPCATTTYGAAVQARADEPERQHRIEEDHVGADLARERVDVARRRVGVGSSTRSRDALDRGTPAARPTRAAPGNGVVSTVVSAGGSRRHSS